MLLTTIPLTTIEGVLVQLKKLSYNDVQPLIDNIIYCINKYTYEDDVEEERNPIGFNINYKDENENGNNIS